MANYNLTQTGAEVQELLNKVSLFGKFTCRDAADSQEKNIHIDDFTLIDGMAIAVTFVNGNSAASIQLNVNYTGNVPVYYRNSPLGAGLFTANATVILMYNATGNRWDVLSELCGTIGEAASRDVATEITDESSDEDIPTVGAVKGTMKGLPEQDCSFVFRKTAGGELTVPSGLAQLTAIRGKSVLWNQKIKNPTFDGITNWYAVGASINAADNVLTWTAINAAGPNNLQQNFDLINNHKLFVRFDIKGNQVNTVGSACGSVAGGGALLNETYDTNWKTISQIAEPTSSTVRGFYIRPNARGLEDCVVYIRNVRIHDLTLMFGAGNEPSTVEEFEAMFPNDYYPYNTGSLLNFNATSLKTVGFNQWDEQWEHGGIDAYTGKNIPDNTALRSKEFIKVLPLKSYYIKIPTNVIVCAYNADKNYLKVLRYGTGNSVIQTTEETQYIKFSSYTDSYSSNYNHDICINISDPSKNGTYEPYWESYLPLNINTLTGKLNGSGDSAIVFPDGMAGMNGVQDIIIGNVAIKKFYQVNDLTTLPITLNYEGYAPEVEEGDTVYSFILELPKNGKAFTSAVTNGLFNKKYSASYGISAASYNNFYIYTLQGKSYVEIMDSTFATDARFADEEQWDALIADIRTSLADKALMYELLSYESYTLDDMAMPLSYKIDKDGTEQIIPSAADPDNTVPSTVPCDMTAKYKLSHVEEIWALFDLCHNG